MTIAAGFVARNGVLLCTDSLYSGGIKVHDRKIFTYNLTECIVSFALAGHEPFAKKAIEESKAYLDANRGTLGSVAAIKGVIESAVRLTWEQCVEARPREDRDVSRFQLLVAIATPSEDAQLFSAVGPVLTPVEKYECFGDGYFVAHHIIGTAYRPAMSLENVATIAVHVLGTAQRYVEGVGGPSQFEVIRDGRITGLPRHYPYDMATFANISVNSFEDRVARLLFDIGDVNMTDSAFDKKLEQFTAAARAMREDWRHDTEYSDLFSAIRDKESA